MNAPMIERLSAALSGRYRIEGELGEGGMATVYLAGDLRHNRKVALKVLKPELAAVVGGERFLTEIETTANLQHPHILPLFDSGEAEGFLFYVMPYVEGESLRDRLDRERQLPVEEAIRISKAVAGALQHAHDRGVVHRDIKPANILLQDGQPVVGDFGIALAVGAAGGARLTETGLSVGTPYYMSPEQATGDQVLGPAADTYALTAVLYEMLTGDPPYVGSTAQAVLGKIIQGGPVSATEVRRSVPPNVDAAIRKGLEKLPADRFSRVDELARALDDPGFRYGRSDTSVEDASRWKRATMGATAAALALAGLAAWALLRPEPPEPVVRFPLATVEGHGPTEYLALTPDGTAAVVSQRIDGELKPVLWRWADLSRTVLPGAVTVATDPFISPAGDEVAFFDSGTLKAVPLGGGLVRTLSEDANCCGRWAADGYIYFSPQARNIVRIPEKGGEVEEVTPVTPGENHGYFQVLPDGDTGVFTVWDDPPRLEGFRISTGERKTITAGVRSYVTPTDHLLFGSLEGRILAARFDPAALEIIGSAVPMVEGVGTSASEEVFYTLAENGTLMYWEGSGLVGEGQRFLWLDRTGEISPVDPDLTFQAGPQFGWSLSPTGDRVAFRAAGEDSGEIWIKTLDRGPLARLTFHSGSDWAPVWSANGDTVFFASDRDSDDGGLDVWARRSDGVGEPVLVLDSDRSVAEFTRSRDGEWFVLRVGAPPSRDLLAQRPGIDAEPIPVAASPDFEEVAPDLSPDGRWIAYASDETGDFQIYVRPFPDVDQGRWQISSGAAIAPRWSEDGRELFFARPEGMYVAQVETEPGFRLVEVRQLFEWPSRFPFAVSPVLNGWYDVTPDGERFLFAGSMPEEVVDEAPEPRLILVQNFFVELERRLPR